MLCAMNKNKIHLKIKKNATVLKVFSMSLVLTWLLVVSAYYSYQWLVKGNVNGTDNKTDVTGEYSVVDPMTLVSLIKTRDQSYILIDVRSKKEYEKSHIRGAVQLSESKKLDSKKTIIVYGNTQYSDETKNVASELAEKGLKVKQLAIGWNEWRHFRNLWVPDNKWAEIDVNDFIVSE